MSQVVTLNPQRLALLLGLLALVCALASIGTIHLSGSSLISVGNPIHSTVGTDRPDYVDQTPLASATITSPGNYIVSTKMAVANTGSNDDYLHCSYSFNQAVHGADGVQTFAGKTASGEVSALIAASDPGTIGLSCMGNQTTSFDISKIKLRVQRQG